MRRFALLATGGILWLFLFVVPALADGGPHVLLNNNGSVTLTGDCAACHRAHTAQAESMLKAAMPGLCTSCHNGTGATTDVVDGVQYVPTDANGGHTGDVVLGALRGGGFSYALIDSGNADRLMYGGRQTVTFTGTASGGSFTLTKFGGSPTATVTWDANATTFTNNLLAALDTIYGTSTAYTSLCTVSNCTSSGTSAYTTHNAIVDNVTNTGFRIRFQNDLAKTPQGLVIVDATSLTGVTAAAVSDTTSHGTSAYTAAVPVLALASKEKVTSIHSNDSSPQNVWGNGPINAAFDPGSGGAELNCAECHNPHGNGQYRILQVTPGEDFSATMTEPDFVPLGRNVEVTDVGVTTSTKNYTVKPGVQATDVAAGATLGDYFRRKFDITGGSNWTNFYLLPDAMNVGWDGTKCVNNDDTGCTTLPVKNTNGTMTAFCVACHTRYSTSTALTGFGANTDTGDAIYKFRHTTSSSVGCEQCHVSHGSNAVMTGPAAGVLDPSGALPSAVPGAGPAGSTTSGDSRLLKVDNRGTCQLCHEPTSTTHVGDTTGTVPVGPTPGP